MIISFRKIFSLNSVGLAGLKNFIIQNYKKLIYKILFGLKKFKMTDDKVKLIRTNFSRTDLIEKKLTKKELKKLSMRPKDLLHFIEEFEKLHNGRWNIHLHILED